MATVGNPGDVPRPSGRVASLTVQKYWPSISETDLMGLADEERAMGTSMSEYGDTVHREMTRGADLLVGQAGDARIALMRKMVVHADESTAYFQSSSWAVNSFSGIVAGLKSDLSRIVDAATDAWNEAQRSGGPAAAAAAMAPFEAEAATLYDAALGDIAATPAILPVPVAPVGDDSPDARPLSDQEEGDEKPETPGAEEEPGAKLKDESVSRGVDDQDTRNYGTETDATGADMRETTVPVPAGTDTGQGLPGTGQGFPGTGLPAAGLPMGGGAGAGGGMPSAGSALGGLRPPQMPSGNPLGSASKSLSDAFTSPASAAGAPLDSGSLTSAASSFNSGLASGIGSSGAVSPAALEKFVAQHPGTTPVVAPSAGQVPAQPPVVASGGGAASAGAAPMVGGGGGMPMMGQPPAPGGGAGALAPFVPPGGGAAAAGVAPAGAASAAAPAAAPPAQQGGAAPVMAGTSGAATAASMPEPEVSADLLLARQVLDGLVRGTAAAWNTIDSGFVNWAVAVVRTLVGPQLVIASSAGGGVYVPASVFVPSTARLAPSDPALPMRWAAGFMGWRRPADVLAGHADALSDKVSGIRRSALVTTVEGPRPSGWTDFETVTLRSILHSAGSAPVLDGAHQHRLTAIDPALAQQLSAIVGGPREIPVAAVITRAVVEAATQTVAATGSNGLPVSGSDGPIQVAEAADLAFLNKLGQGTPVDWNAYNDEVAQRHEGNATSPHLNGPLDLDDSDPSQHARMLYIAFYRTALIAEMIRYWQQPTTPSLADIVYCAKTAGFGQVVASTLAAL